MQRRVLFFVFAFGDPYTHTYIERKKKTVPSVHNLVFQVLTVKHLMGRDFVYFYAEIHSL